MSLKTVFDIAATAATAQNMRLNTVSSNIANADTVAEPDGSVYRAKQVVFQPLSVAPGAAGLGVQVASVVEDNATPRRVHDPKHPLADADGYVTLANVNVVDEMVNMISASRAYQNAVEVMNTAKQLQMKVLTLGS
jgi:flagellar basal-body rod protein FlgC